MPYPPPSIFNLYFLLDLPFFSSGFKNQIMLSVTCTLCWYLGYPVRKMALRVVLSAWNSISSLYFCHLAFLVWNVTLGLRGFLLESVVWCLIFCIVVIIGLHLPFASYLVIKYKILRGTMLANKRFCFFSWPKNQSNLAENKILCTVPAGCYNSLKKFNLPFCSFFDPNDVDKKILLRCYLVIYVNWKAIENKEMKKVGLVAAQYGCSLDK